MWFLPLRNVHRLPILGLYCNGRAGVRLGPESEAEQLREKRGQVAATNEPTQPQQAERVNRLRVD